MDLRCLGFLEIMELMVQVQADILQAVAAEAVNPLLPLVLVVMVELVVEVMVVVTLIPINLLVKQTLVVEVVEEHILELPLVLLVDQELLPSDMPLIDTP